MLVTSALISDLLAKQVRVCKDGRCPGQIEVFEKSVGSLEWKTFEVLFFFRGPIL